MTLSRVLIAAMMLVTTMAQAAVVLPSNEKGRGRGGDYGPVQPGGPDRGGDYGPIQPYPDEPNYGRNRTQEIYVGRYVRNESVDILREISHLRGSRVASVRIFIERSREVRSSVELLVNGRSEDSRAADVGRAVVLSPRSILEIGRRLNRLEVYARGEMLINRIVVELATEGNRPPPYQPPHDGDRNEIAVNLNLPSYLPPQPRLDLTPYIDVNRYRGYAVRGVEITAVARSNSSTLDVLLNGFNEGQLRLSTHQSTHVIRTRQNLVIGSSFGNLVVAPRGDSNLVQVRLLLSR